MIDPQIDLSVIELPSEVLIVDRYRLRPGVQDLIASAPKRSKGSSAALCHYLSSLALHLDIRLTAILLDCLNSQIQISTSG